MSRVTAIVCSAVMCLLISMAWAINHYRNNAIDYKRQRDDATHGLKLANATIEDMQVRQRDVAALDAKYTGELADAKSTIDQLERDVAAGKRRLQLNATCGKDGASDTSGLGDAVAPRLTDSAQRDYFILRERITTITGQVSYLQDYIRTQCLR